MSWNAPIPPAPVDPSTPTGPPSHGTSSARGLHALPGSARLFGRFGRMFRNLPVIDHDATQLDQLTQLADRMIKGAEQERPLGEADTNENPDIPAGYTYLGQFIDHDITFDPVTSLQRQNDPDAFENFRSPRFDLDSLYGSGPADQPYLYENDRPGHLRLGAEVSSEPSRKGPDLPRLEAPHSRALIGDPRNDENLIVSQLHSVFIRFHNAVLDGVTDEGLSADDRFKTAQHIVRWHYQWIVVHDFLAKVVGDEVVADILRAEPWRIVRWDGNEGSGSWIQEDRTVLRPRLLFYEPGANPYMPVEFSVAAYRFGHSMVRPSYVVNSFVRDAVAQQDEGKQDAEKMHGRTKIFSDNLEPDNIENFNGGRPLPGEWGLGWEFFFETGEGEPLKSYRIDDELVNPLGSLVDPPPLPDMRSLALRNLLRGARLGLPSGEAVARRMGVEPLDDAALDLGSVAPAFVGQSPLWYYILREARLLGGGRRLGPVGGRIVAEVLIGLLAADPLSFLAVELSWKPTLGPSPGEFRMPDLLRVAGAL